MKKTLLWIVILISLTAILMRYSTKIAEVVFNIRQKAGISILSQPEGAQVFLNDSEVGKTPYENKDLEVNDYLVRIKKDARVWQGKVSLTAGTLAVVNRELSESMASSSGEILTLKSGKGLTVVSNPSDSDVEIDGKSFGKTPQTFDIPPGEHIVQISHSNFLKRSIKANLPDNFNLLISSDLAISEADLTAVTTAPITVTPQVVVKNTPTNFLRVRDKPTLSGKEIAQVKPGDVLILIEELASWDRVRLPDGTEGYVSSAYVSKKETQGSQ